MDTQKSGSNIQPYRRPEYAPACGCLLRVFWMMAGNMILLGCIATMLRSPSDVLGIADACYWATVGTLLAARYADIRFFKGTTAEGKPASLAHWRRYAVLVLLVSGVVWGLGYGLTQL